MENFAQFSGKVTQKLFGKGSKSEHLAVVLETQEGDLVLRRPGANPFNDPELERLVGKTICAQGQRRGNLLYVLQWAGVDNSGSYGLTRVKPP